MNKNMNYPLYTGAILVAILLFLSLFGSYMAPHSLNDEFETAYINRDIQSPPIKPLEIEGWPLGTDRWGYDILSMLLHGIKYTVLVSLIVTILKMLIGTIIGIYLGTRKKPMSWMVAFENTWSYVPLFLIVYFFLIPFSLYETKIEPNVLVTYFIIITTIVSIPSIVSSVRKKSEEISKTTYVESAKTLGASRHRIVWKHIFPQMKESLLIMFVLEVVFVIAIMGQLALVNVFVGGTRISLDPVMYFSITKEVSGLVGQARLNIYGSQYILLIPLTVLLFTTGSFSLLANGLKNRYQTNYQKTPWVFTGQVSKLLPVRRVQEKKNKWWFLKGESLAVLVGVLIFACAGGYVVASKDDEWGVANGSKAKYDLSLKMAREGDFKVDSEIDVENVSNKAWEDLVFYFIPNSFEEGHNFKGIKGFSEVEIGSIEVDGVKANYELDNDTLRVKLAEKLGNGENAKVRITYHFTVPEEGQRFSRYKEHYYLAQWYPMLATYQKGKWNKADYSEGMETYHTDFSDFKVNYSVPKGYSVISTSDQDLDDRRNKGQLKMEHVREFYLAVVKDFFVKETESKGVKVRVFSREDHNRDTLDTLTLAKKALDFYQTKIGEYPQKQLDIILEKGLTMEYPGIVTVDPYTDNDEHYRNSVVHEIAHQYFYGMVANDSFKEAWLDEGMSEFATNMFFYIGENLSPDTAQALSIDRMNNSEVEGFGRQKSNVTVNENQHAAFIYSQPALQLFKLTQNHYQYRGKDHKEVTMDYLSDYYHQFQNKQVDTKQFIQFTRNYFDISSDHFGEWLETD